MAIPAAQTVTSPWAAHRRRGEALGGRYPHATQVLTLYLALLDVWEEAWRGAQAAFPPRSRSCSGPKPANRAEQLLDRRGGGLAGWAAERVAPLVVAATVESGPEPLAAAVSGFGNLEPLLAGWLAGTEPDPVGRYLARAVLRGPLEAVDVAAACAQDPSPRGGRNCPSCGGRPQLSFRANADDALVSGRRCLSCVRCGSSWAYAGNTCAWCGETSGARRTVFAEHRDGPVVGRGNGQAPGGDAPLFPHLRIEACEACAKYLIDVDLGLDPRAVPEVDELAALPLDLFATERGLAKIAPNLMGF